MASASDLHITYEIEPLVKLACKATDCKHNLMQTRMRMAACNLKMLTIKKAGQCESYEPQRVSDGKTES